MYEEKITDLTDNICINFKYKIGRTNSKTFPELFEIVQFNSNKTSKFNKILIN